jgi:hypothetical protein
MGMIGYAAIALLVLIVIGLGASGSISALDSGYHKLVTNSVVQKIESQAVTKVVALQPSVQKLVNEVTAKIS